MASQAGPTVSYLIRNICGRARERDEALRDLIDRPIPHSHSARLAINNAKSLQPRRVLRGYLATNRKNDTFAGVPVALLKQATQTPLVKPARSAVVQDTLEMLPVLRVST